PDGRAEDQEESGESRAEDRSTGLVESVGYSPDRLTGAHSRQHQHTFSRPPLLFRISTSVLPIVRRLRGHKQLPPRATPPEALLLVLERTEKGAAGHVRRRD